MTRDIYMKVLILSNMYPHSRKPYSGSFVRDQANALTKQGVECVVVASAESRKAFSYVLSKYLILLLRAVLAAFTQKFHVVHAHYVFPTGVIGYVASLINQSLLVVTVHGGDINFIKPGTHWLIKFVLQRADFIIPVSEDLRIKLVDEFGISKSKMCVIDMGVDTELFSAIPKDEARRRLGLPDHVTIFISIGNLNWQKGIHFLLQFMAKFTSSDRRVLMILVGSGPQAAKFKKLSADLGLTEQVFFVGNVEKVDIPVWLSSADYLIHPTLREAFGLAVIEAMSCRKVVIASKVGGIPEFVIDNENGFLVEPGNPEALEQKMADVLSLPKRKIEQVQFLARATAKQHDYLTQASKVKSVYHQLMELK